MEKSSAWALVMLVIVSTAGLVCGHFGFAVYNFLLILGSMLWAAAIAILWINHMM